MKMLSGTASVLLLFLVPLSSWAFHCFEDTPIENGQEYTYEIPAEKPLEDKRYWFNYHMNYQVFGKFNADPSNTVITAGLYDKDENTVYPITIDCASNSWTSHTVVAETLEVTEVYTGKLEKGCTAGAEFDIWLKVQQPHMMNWIFDGQALQFELWNRHNDKPDRPLKVPNHYWPDTSTKFEVTVSDKGASLERFTFGKCVSWPDSLRENCYEARKWVHGRSKMFGGYEDVRGKGHFGANNQPFAPVCYFDSQYYNFLQGYVHPDENSHSKMYCCCVDMVTGQITKQGDGRDDCGISGKPGLEGCSRSCGHNAQQDLMQEAIIAYEEMVKAEEAAEKEY